MTTKVGSTEFMVSLGGTSTDDVIADAAADLDQQKRNKMTAELSARLRQVALDLCEADVTNLTEMVRLQSEAKALKMQLSHFTTQAKGETYVA